jgi:trk system potassium uptake protein
MKVVILGCGRVGSRLALLMMGDGHEVSIIDSDPAAFDRLPEDFSGETILGTGIDIDVLKSAGIESADAFAAVTNFDNTNIMASEIAKEIFGVERVLARIYDPGRESFYHELGLETVCPTTLVANAVHNILSPENITSVPRQTAPLPRVTNNQTGAGLSMPSLTAPGVSATPGAGNAQSAIVQEQFVPDHSTSTSDAPANPKPPDNGRGLRGLFRS